MSTYDFSRVQVANLNYAAESAISLMEGHQGDIAADVYSGYAIGTGMFGIDKGGNRNFLPNKKKVNIHNKCMNV